MSEERVYNFNPGPATLPLTVLEEVQRDLLALPGEGTSVLEISHRGPRFAAILEEAEENLRRLLGLGDEHQVLFLPGGATLQFSMVPMGLLGEGGSADYLLTGSWGNKALQEAEKVGAVRRAWDGAGEGYVRVPATGELDLSPHAAYLHYTSNETIEGVQFPEPPAAGEVPLVCDASSDFLSRPLDVSRHGLVYAGAQKNLGPAGVTVVLLRRDLLERLPQGLPSMLDYRLHAAKRSTLNTPPVFPIYVVMLVSRWLLAQGGLDETARRNEEKSRLLYRAIDDSGGFYRGHARPDSRSRMNVTWRLPDPELETRFLAQAAARGLAGLKGHRSVGGIRASIYNAMPRSGVEALAAFMDDFRRTGG